MKYLNLFFVPLVFLHIMLLPISGTAADIKTEISCCKIIGCNMRQSPEEKIIVFNTGKQKKGFYTFSNSMTYYFSVPRIDRIEDGVRIEEGFGITKPNGKQYIYKIETQTVNSKKIETKKAENIESIAKDNNDKFSDQITAPEYYYYTYTAEVSERELTKTEQQLKNMVAAIESEESLKSFKASAEKIHLIQGAEALSADTRKILINEMSYQIEGYIQKFSFPIGFNSSPTQYIQAPGYNTFLNDIKKDLTQKLGRVPNDDEIKTSTDKGLEIMRLINAKKIAGLKLCESIPELKPVIAEYLKKIAPSIDLTKVSLTKDDLDELNNNVLQPDTKSKGDASSKKKIKLSPVKSKSAK